jgi:hypothetical protein
VGGDRRAVDAAASETRKGNEKPEFEAFVFYANTACFTRSVNSVIKIFLVRLFIKAYL